MPDSPPPSDSHGLDEPSQFDACCKEVARGVALWTHAGTQRLDRPSMPRARLSLFSRSSPKASILQRCAAFGPEPTERHRHLDDLAKSVQGHAPPARSPRPLSAFEVDAEDRSSLAPLQLA